MKHTDKYGNKTPIKDLETSHLKNIIAYHNRIAKEGLEVFQGGGVDADDIWGDTYTLYGKDALVHLKTNKYVKELTSRNNLMKYKVTIAREELREHTFEVDATCHGDAVDIALEYANSHDFCEDPVHFYKNNIKYVIPDV